ncbi:MAG: hypothetical protein FJ387_19755 [Verrucomicrobia bacterium]|nr:hypothetical protein [Verrucomicrobiota bacterium]
MPVETYQPVEAAARPRVPRFKVVGIGGAGLQALTQMQAAGLRDVRLAVLHTDARALGQAGFEEQVLLGEGLTRGLGAGGDPGIGRAAAEAEVGRLSQVAAGCDLLMIVAGLGGGTGSGVAPVLARVARESGALVMGLVTLPFEFEGARRQQQAQVALRQLKTAADAVVCLPNQKLAALLDEHTTLVEALRIGNGLLTEGVRGLWRLATRDGLLKVDFADLCSVVRGRQAESCFATAEGSGENRLRQVLDHLLASPLLDQGRVLGDAEAVLISLVGGLDLTLKDVHQFMQQIERLCENARVVLGAAVDPDFNGRLAVTLVATRRARAAPGEEGSAEPVEVASHLPTAEFPVSPEEPAGTHGATVGDRSASRYLPSAPELPPERVRELYLQQEGGGRRRRKAAARLRQGLLPLEVVPKGRFEKSEPTLRRGEDLDTPTYLRRGMVLNWTS